MSPPPPAHTHTHTHTNTHTHLVCLIFVFYIRLYSFKSIMYNCICTMRNPSNFRWMGLLIRCHMRSAMDLNFIQLILHCTLFPFASTCICYFYCNILSCCRTVCYSIIGLVSECIIRFLCWGDSGELYCKILNQQISNRLYHNLGWWKLHFATSHEKRCGSFKHNNRL